jgi:hypothetical protein
LVKAAQSSPGSRARGLEVSPECADLDQVIWLLAIWALLLGLWGVSKPGNSGEIVMRLARVLQERWFADAGHPFDWAKD